MPFFAGGRHFLKNKLQKPQRTARQDGAKRKEKTELMSTNRIIWDREQGFRMNLQMFAEEAAETAPDDGGESQTQNAPANNQTFTWDQVMKLVQSESDKRVTAALAKQEKAHKREMSLSGLDEQQRELAKRDQTIADLQERNRSLTIAQNKAELIKTLAGRGLPVEFADVIEVGEDVEKAQQKVDALDAAFKRAVEDAVKTRLAGKTMPGRGGAATSITKAEILAIKDAKERQTAIANNMHLFQKG
jgi:hypothetical protein